MPTKKGINLPQVKKRNLSLIKEIIYQYSPISRANVAEMLSLTPATITNNVSLLIESSLVREISLDDIPEENGVGRRPIMLEFIAESSYVIGIEISPRGVFLCLCNAIGNVIGQKKIKINYLNYEQCICDVASNIEVLIEDSKVPRNMITSIGVGIPGFIDHKTGFIKNGIWKEWQDKHVELDLHQKTGISVCIDNNATVRAVAEALFDKNRSATFAYLFVSRGICCPLMIQKNSDVSRMIAGSGELGHMSIDINGPKCEWCGDYGCLNTFTGESGIRKRCAEAIAMNADTILKDFAVNPENPTIEEIVLAALKEDKIVNDILDNAIKYLATGICNIIKFISPEMVIVDAYIMTIDQLKNKFLEYVEIHLAHDRWGEVKFIFKPFNEYGGAIGSAAYAIKSFIIDK